LKEWSIADEIYASMQDAAPTQLAFTTYCGLVAIQLLLALVMPGVDQEGDSVMRLEQCEAQV
jgi:hypothetical protein